MSSIRVNLISIVLWGKVGVRVSFESNKIVMTKNNVFLRKGYCDQDVYVVNIYEIVNEYGSSAYIVYSYDVSYAKLRHVNSLCVMKL